MFPIEEGLPNVRMSSEIPVESRGRYKLLVNYSSSSKPGERPKLGEAWDRAGPELGVGHEPGFCHQGKSWQVHADMSTHKIQEEKYFRHKMSNEVALTCWILYISMMCILDTFLPRVMVYLAILAHELYTFMNVCALSGQTKWLFPYLSSQLP